MKWLVLALLVVVLSSFVSGVYVEDKVQELLDARLPEVSVVSRTVSSTATMDVEQPEFNVIVMLNKDKAVTNTSVDLARVRHTYSTFEGFSGNFTYSEILELIENDAVKGIYYNHRVQAFLQDSAPLINATEVWPLQVNGMNLTGAGQTVCVLDTGVDYTHPDLGGGWGNKVIAGYRSLFNRGDQQDCSTNNAACMDDNGHGTHVAGIIAANGGLRGVAPDAKIAAVKVLEQSGGGWTSDIVAGIDWCNDNSDTYNISIISMSLGGTPYNDTYCQNSYNAPITTAASNNISVVVATGNEGNTTQIASPACVEEAIRVAATTKQDFVTDYSDRWSLDLLLAPGGIWNGPSYSEIVSLFSLNVKNNPYLCFLENQYGQCFDNTYKVTINSQDNYIRSSGTSMAAPHVSGAIAIINQYLKERNQSMTPKEIEQLLNDTGKPIFDDETGLYFSRIDVFAAIQELTSFPEVILHSPRNGTITKENVTFNCSATSDVDLTTATLTIWNSTGLYLENTTTLDGTEAAFNQTLEEGNYEWNCRFTNNQGNEAFAADNYQLTIDLTPPNITIDNPVEGFYNTANITLNFTAIDALSNISHCWYMLNNTQTNLPNCTNTTLTNLTDGEHTVFVYANDTLNNTNQANITFTVDTIPPNITIHSPANQIYSNETILINATAEDLHLESVWFIHNNETISIPSEVNFTEGQHTVIIYANDSAGNINQTNVTFSVDLNPPVFIRNNVISPVMYEDNKSYNFSAQWFDISPIESFLVFNNSEFNITEGPHTITNLSAGAHEYYFWANDSFGRISQTANFTLLILEPENTTILAEMQTLTPSENITTIILPSNSPTESITITNTTKLNLSFIAENNSAKIQKNLTVSQNNHSIRISENTTITGNESWDKLFLLPDITNSDNLSLSAQSIDLVLKIGSEQQLNFSKPVNITLAGMQGKRAAWTSGFSGSLTPISNKCKNSSNPVTVPCYKDKGNDLVIWTNHASTYAAYTPHPPPPTGGGGGGGGGSSAMGAPPPQNISRGITIPFFNTQAHTQTEWHNLSRFDWIIKAIAVIPTENTSRIDLSFRKISDTEFELLTNNSFESITLLVEETDYILTNEDDIFIIENRTIKISKTGTFRFTFPPEPDPEDIPESVSQETEITSTEEIELQKEQEGWTNIQTIAFFFALGVMLSGIFVVLFVFKPKKPKDEHLKNLIKEINDLSKQNKYK